MLTLIASWKVIDSAVELAVESWKSNGFRIISVNNQKGPWDDLEHIEGVRTEQEFSCKESAPIIKSMIIESSNLFQKDDMIGLINADIIIPKGCGNIFDKIISSTGRDVFLTANRYDIEQEDFKQIKGAFQSNDWGNIPVKKHPDQSGDIFISSAENMVEMAHEMPEFILGRLAWDNWIHWYFLNKKKIPCYNIRPVFPLFHQDHDSRGRDERMKALRELPAVKHNYDLFFRAGIGKVPSINSWPCPIEDETNWNLRRA